jgi:hypothetical protein
MEYLSLRTVHDRTRRYQARTIVGITSEDDVPFIVDFVKFWGP